MLMFQNYFSFLCVWRWGGTLVFSKTLNNTNKNKNTKNITHPFGALHWFKSSELIVASRESQVMNIRFAVDDTYVSIRSSFI